MDCIGRLGLISQQLTDQIFQFVNFTCVRQIEGATDTAISVDGRYIAFESEASNLVATDTNGVSDVFGAALWAMHYALATSERGAGINFHGFLGVCGQPTVNGKNDFYTPICAANAAGPRMCAGLIRQSRGQTNQTVKRKGAKLRRKDT